MLSLLEIVGKDIIQPSKISNSLEKNCVCDLFVEIGTFSIVC